MSETSGVVKRRRGQKTRKVMKTARLPLTLGADGACTVHTAHQPHWTWPNSVRGSNKLFIERDHLTTT